MTVTNPSGWEKVGYEQLLLLQIAGSEVSIPMPQKEYKFHHSRKWRFDLAWPLHHVAVEIEGGVWVKGRHTRGSGFVKDCEKYNTAAIDGWRVLRMPSDWILDGTAIQQIEDMFTNGFEHERNYDE